MNPWGFKMIEVPGMRFEPPINGIFARSGWLPVSSFETTFCFDTIPLNPEAVAKDETPETVKEVW